MFYMFPDLRQIILLQESCSYQCTNHLDNPFQFTNSKLEKIKEFGGCELTCQLALSDFCHKLKLLDLSFVPMTGITSNSIIRQLKNMPVLETLALRHFRVKLKDLEILHRNIPSIKNLHLWNTEMISGDIPHDVIPAMLITEITRDLKGVDNLNARVQFYKYLYNKYPPVKKPAYYDTVTSNRSSDYVRSVYNRGILPFYQIIGPHTHTIHFSDHCQ